MSNSGEEVRLANPMRIYGPFTNQSGVCAVEIRRIENEL